MKHTVVNELNNFDYHDARLKMMQWDGSRFVWAVSAINATTKNSQNSFSKDMCIADATLVFDDARIESIAFGGYKTVDSTGNLIKSVAPRAAKPDEYKEILAKTPNSYSYIYSMGKYETTKDGGYIACFDIDGGAGSYNLTIVFSKSAVCWDEFSGEAWYEHPKWKKQGDA